MVRVPECDPGSGDSVMVILQVDPATLGLNLFLLIGAAVLLGGVSLVALAGWTGLRAWIWHVRQRRSQQRYRRRTFRADGQIYPSVSQGVCQECGRSSRKIYHPLTGERLCPVCYERFWRQAEGCERRTPTRQMDAAQRSVEEVRAPALHTAAAVPPEVALRAGRPFRTMTPATQNGLRS